MPSSNGIERTREIASKLQGLNTDESEIVKNQCSRINTRLVQTRRQTRHGRYHETQNEKAQIAVRKGQSWQEREMARNSKVAIASNGKPEPRGAMQRVHHALNKSFAGTTIIIPHNELSHWGVWKRNMCQTWSKKAAIACGRSSTALYRFFHKIGSVKMYGKKALEGAG
ncbi:hypothetical protein C8R44DRAFT_736840 [Mycena epipterygia]|nr:hypothetical protein C8R44DRAFT_736840 [Mycena epipterygia]